MLIGLTGGIGCGKSTALRIFQQLGWPIIDADAICREYYEQQDERLIQPLITRWGKSSVILPDGTPDKQYIADQIFNDPTEMEFLESIMIPLIKERAYNQINELGDAHKIFDVPLLFEFGWDTDCDYTISVWADKDSQYQRLYDRGWSEKEIERRINTQMSSEKKLQLADYGLINTGSIDILFQQCEKLLKQFV
jgi:dephospho-CoA kinase